MQPDTDEITTITVPRSLLSDIEEVKRRRGDDPARYTPHYEVVADVIREELDNHDE